MNLNDLAVLSYADNNCYVKATRTGKVDGLELDLKNQTWTWKMWENIPIGSGRHLSRNYMYGVIGVYDSRQVRHLNTMVHDATDAIRIHKSPLETD